MPHIFQHHSHHAKRNPKNAKQFPIISKLVLFMAVAEPLMSLPQVYEVWVNHQTAGVSLATWAFLLAASITWLVYSIKVRDFPVIVASVLWTATESLLVIGLLIFQ